MTRLASIGSPPLTLADATSLYVPARIMPAPGGPGVDDTPALLELLALSAVDQRPIHVPAGDYRLISQEVVWPDGVGLFGAGIEATNFIVNAAGSLRFGVIDGSGAQRFPFVRDFSINGVNTAVSPLRVGHIANSLFANVKVQNAAASAAAILVQTAQNTTWVNVQATGNNGLGIQWDLGVANHTLLGCIFSGNGSHGQRFCRTAATPANTSTFDSPNNFRVFGGLNEDSDTGNAIRIESGSGLHFFGVQTSALGATGTPTLLMEKAGGTTIGTVLWHGGQLKAGASGAPAGICARVLDGTLVVDGDCRLRGALHPFRVGDTGLIKLRSYDPDSGTDLTALVIAEGTKAVGRLVSNGRDEYEAVTTAAFTFAATTTLATVAPATGPPLTLDVLPGDYEVQTYLPMTGPDAADIKIGWALPAGATLSWTGNGLATSVGANGLATIYRTQLTGAQSSLNGTSTGLTTVALPLGKLTVTTAGTVSVTAAQVVSDAGSSSILSGARLVLRRLL